MATNELLPFANGNDANVMPTAQWQALTDILANGFQSGVARSEQVNRVLAQGAVASYVLGQLIVDQLNQNATLDEATLYQNLILALQENAKDACLPLTGGTMTGVITSNRGTNAIIASVNNTNMVRVYGGSTAGTGANLDLYGGENAEKGAFILRARNSSKYIELKGETDGAFTWDGKEVERIESIVEGGVRYTSGLQVCWGRVNTKNGTNVSTTFPMAFSSAPVVSGSRSSSETTTTIVNVWIRSVTSTAFNVYSTPNDTGFYYIACGTWK